MADKRIHIQGQTVYRALWLFIAQSESKFIVHDALKTFNSSAQFISQVQERTQGTKSNVEYLSGNCDVIHYLRQTLC